MISVLELILTIPTNVVLIWGMNSVAILIQIQDVKKKEILMKLPLLQIWDCIFNSIPSSFPLPLLIRLPVWNLSARLESLFAMRDFLSSENSLLPGLVRASRSAAAAATAASFEHISPPSSTSGFVYSICSAVSFSPRRRPLDSILSTFSGLLVCAR